LLPTLYPGGLREEGIPSPPVRPKGAWAEVQILFPCRAAGRVFRRQALAGAVRLDDPDKTTVRPGLDGPHALPVEGAGRRGAFRDKWGAAAHASEAEGTDRQKRRPPFPFEAWQGNGVAPARWPG